MYEVKTKDAGGPGGRPGAVEIADRPKKSLTTLGGLA
jgi:hypothetical protein